MSRGTQPTQVTWELHAASADLPGSPGGIVKVYLAAVALNVGDAVFLSGASTVNKAAVSGAQASARIGIVVGGAQTGYECAEDPAVVGVLAANVGERVMVCVMGSCYAIADAAIAVGVRLRLSGATAGRLVAATDLSITAGAVAVTSSAANGAADISGDGFGRIIGVAETAAAGAASVFLVSVLVC